MMYRFTSGNKCITQVGHMDHGGGCACTGQEKSLGLLLNFVVHLKLL